MYREGRCRDLLVTCRACLHRGDAGFVSSMAIETALAAHVRGVVVRPLLVATLTVLRRNGRLLVRLVAILAVGRGVLHDGLLRALRPAMTIDACRRRRGREGVTNEAVGLGGAARVRVGKLLLVASGANAGTWVRKSSSIDVVAFSAGNRSFSDVSFVSGTVSKLRPRWRHHFSRYGNWAPRQEPVKSSDSRGNEHEHDRARRKQRTTAGSHGTPA
jgi:hypothetical protein